MSSASKSRRLKALAICIVVLLTLLVLLVDLNPTIPNRNRPSANDIGQARSVWTQLQDAQSGNGPTVVAIDEQQLAGLSALYDDTNEAYRFDGNIERGQFIGKASISMPLGFWINTQATFAGHHDGFPDFNLKVGQVTFPNSISRWLTELARLWANSNGTHFPPFDQIFEKVVVQDGQVVAHLSLPNHTTVLESAFRSNGLDLDTQLVEQIYCKIAVQQRNAPVRELPQLVNRIFAQDPTERSSEFNQAALVSLALIIVGEPADQMISDVFTLRQKCSFPPSEIELHGRTDLAKHWTYSAALTARFGPMLANNLGEWKELDDSLPGGSGFSFVDLAADRSGVGIAKLAISPQTSTSMSIKLGSARAFDLLPSSLLVRPEDISENEFSERFGNLEEKRYRDAVSYIDASLTRAGTLGP